jgi:hypothetical protein
MKSVAYTGGGEGGGRGGEEEEEVEEEEEFFRNAVWQSNNGGSYFKRILGCAHSRFSRLSRVSQQRPIFGHP